MKQVAVIDSGSGGLNVLKELFADCKDCNFLFLADEKNAPYGQKSQKELINISCYLIDFLNSFFMPDIIIFACNTLTATTIDFVRKKYKNIIFIGCEPALKPACAKYRQEEVLLLATPVTLEKSKLIKKYKNVNKLAIENLPMLIDKNLFDLDLLVPILKSNIEIYSPKAIVLGCTHFEAIKKQISSFTNAELFGSSIGIAKRLNNFCNKTGGCDCSFMTTGDGSSLANFYHYLTKFD